MDDLRKEANIGIRSVLTSTAKLLNVNELFYDYIKLTGSPIPLRSLGYRNLHEYLRSIPDVVSLDHPESPHSIVRPVVDDKLRHIANFVKEQKVSKNDRTSRRPYLRRSRINEFVPFDLRHRLYERLSQYPEGIHLDDFRGLVDHIQREMGTRCTFDVILEKLSFCTQIVDQYISLTKRPNSLKTPDEIATVSDSESDDIDEWLSESEEYAYSPDRVNGHANEALPECSRDKSRPTSSHEKPKSGCSSASSSGIELISDSLVKNLYALMDENPSGIWLTDLSKKYEAKYGYSLNPYQHGFDCVLELVNKLKHVFHMTKYEKSGDIYVKDARKCTPEDTDTDQGELPKSVVYDIQKMILSRPKPQIYTDELATEFKERYKKTLDPSEFGFPNMDCLLRSLIENENSTFSMKSIRNRTLLYLKGTQQEEKNDHTEYEAALPDDVVFDIMPKEVCNYDFYLPVNPIIKEITKGMRIRVKIAEVYSPERFYLHFAEDVDNLNMMMEDLHQFYERNGDNYEVFHDTVRRGMLCACPFSGDSKWHRVQVITCRGTATVKVRFLDYGTAEDVLMNKLRYLHKDFGRLPAMSIRTKLNGIKAIPNEAKKSYSREVCEFFFNLANVDYLEAEIVNADLTNSSLEVYLYAHQPGGDTVCVHERLIELGLVARKEIDNEIEVPSRSTPVAATLNSVPSNVPQIISQIEIPLDDTSQKKKKNRLPPGIPIIQNSNSVTNMPNSNPMVGVPNSNPQASVPNMSTANSVPNLNAENSVPKTTKPQNSLPNFNVPSSIPTFTKADTRPAFSASKMNPLNPPFYPSSYVQRPQMQQAPPPPQQPPMYTPPQRPLMYAQPMRIPSPYGMCYNPYAGMPNPYDYYSPPMRVPPPVYYAPKPPPGFDYNAKPPQSAPENVYFTGDPLYANPKMAKEKECFNGVDPNMLCGCGFDCQEAANVPKPQGIPPPAYEKCTNVTTQPTFETKSTNVPKQPIFETRSTNVPSQPVFETTSNVPSKSTVKESKNVDGQPEWITKLSLISDLIKNNNVSQETIKERLGEMINDINKGNDSPKNASKKDTISSQNYNFEPSSAQINEVDIPKNTPINDTSSSHNFEPEIARSKSVEPEDEELFPKLQDLVTTLKEPNTKQPETGSPSRAESESSCVSDGKMSTKDELKMRKLEQLKMFVMSQNRSMKRL